MTRMDTARETAGRTKDALTPYAATAMDAATRYADEARNLLGPKIEALGPKAAAAGAQARHGAAQAAQSARVQYTKHLAPHLEHAFNSLPPETQKATLKAVHRAQEAALAAKLSATQAAGQARSTVVPRVTDAVQGARESMSPLAQEAQARGAAALIALQGHVSAAEISDLAAKNIKKEQRSGWATGLAVAGTIAIGSGVLAWQWYRKQSNPEWLVEPPATAGGTGASGASGTSGASDSPGAVGTPAGGAHAAGSTTPAGSASGAPVGDTVMNGSAPRESANGTPESRSAEPKPASPKQDTPKPASDDRPKPHDPRKPH